MSAVFSKLPSSGAYCVISSTTCKSRGLSIVSVALDLATDLSESPDWSAKKAVVFGTGAYAGATMSLLRERGCTDVSVYSSSGRAAGMLLALAGVAVLNSAPTKSGGATLAGDLLTLAGALAFAVFTVAGKRATASHGAVMVNTFAYVGGGLALSPLTLCEASRVSLAAISLKAWACLLYMALFPSLVCYLIFYYVLTHLPASRVSAFSYLQPLIATTAGALILKEPVSAALISGGTLVFAGVFITERA